MFERSENVSIIVSILAEKKVGEEVGYEELSAAVGKNVQRESRSSLSSAMRIVQNESGAVFGTIRGVGVKRLSDTEISRLAPSYLRRSHNAAKTGRNKLRKADTSNMSEAEKLTYYAGSSHLAMIAEATTERASKKVLIASNATGMAIPYRKAIEAIK